jgi:ZIP family zinc transporter
METGSILFAFGLTLFAGLATGIGSTLAFVTKKPGSRFLSGTLGFSAGVMIYVSMIEIFVKAKDSLSAAFGAKVGYVYATLGFFAGIAVIGLIDKLVPSFENPHEMRNVASVPEPVANPAGVGEVAGVPVQAHEHDVKSRFLRMGIFSALAIAIHNFPEGLATFIGALEDTATGVSIAVAIAIHNIPEGIAVSVPILLATGSRRKAFGLSFLSGLSEPIGALIGFFILRTFMSDAVFGITFAAVAGIMVYISLDELLPTAEKYGEHHIAIWGLVLGMGVMAVSLLLFA